MGRKPITYGAGLGELAKKLEEITTLSNTEAFMIACSHRRGGEPDLTIFRNSPSRSSTLINRPNIPGIQEREKGEDDLPSWDPSLDSYSKQQLQQLLNYLETKSSKVDHKIKFLERGNAAGESSDMKVNGSGPLSVLAGESSDIKVNGSGPLSVLAGESSDIKVNGSGPLSVLAGESSDIKVNGSGPLSVLAGESSDIKVNGSGPSNMKYQDKQQPLIIDTIANDSNIVNVHPSGPSNIKESMTAGDMAANISLADQPSNITADDARTPTFNCEDIQFWIDTGILIDDYPGSFT